MGAGDRQAGLKPSNYHSMAGSPRYPSGCVSTFLHLIFDWNPAKRRFASTKRLDEGKCLELKTMRRSRSACSGRGSDVKLLPQMVRDHYVEAVSTESEKSVDVEEGGEGHHGVGVKARLRGLQPSPKSITQPHRRRCRNCGRDAGRVLSRLADRSVDVSDGTVITAPVLRQDQSQFRSSRRRTLRDNMLGFAKHEVGMPDMDGGYSKPYRRFRTPQLAPSASSTHRRTIPSTLMVPSKVLAPRGCTAVVRKQRGPVLSITLQQAPGRPLAGHRMRDLDHESASSGDEAISVRTSDSDSLSTGRANVRRRIRGRSSTWSGSEGSDSGNEQEIPINLGGLSAPSLPGSRPSLLKLTRTVTEADTMAAKILSNLDAYRALKVRQRSTSHQVVSGRREFPFASTSPSRAAPAERRRHDKTLNAPQEEENNIEWEMNFCEQERMRDEEGNASAQGVSERGREKVCEAPFDLQALMSCYRLNTSLEDTTTSHQNSRNSNHDALRARPSIDEAVRPCSFDRSKLAIPLSSVSDEFDLERTMFGRRFDYLTGCGSGNANVTTVDDVKWVDDEKAEQHRDSPLCGRCCGGIPCDSGLSTSSGSIDTWDMDDERHGDACSSCASADSDSARTFEILETDADSDLELEKPAFVKMVCEESDQNGVSTMGTAAEDLEQPSPVSILNSPFHDEPCTSSESSRADSHRQVTRLDEDGFESRTNDDDKIRQALRDISTFQSLEVLTFDYKERNAPTDEQRFVLAILSAAELLPAADRGSSSPTWFKNDSAIDPSLFDRLELCGDVGGCGGLWRSDRKLLFDCVSEAFTVVLSRYRLGSERGLQQCRPKGKKLAEDVQKKIEEWRKRDGVESEMDDCIMCGWKDFSAEVSEVGLAIESMLWRAIVEEAVDDILASSKRRTSCYTTDEEI